MEHLAIMNPAWRLIDKIISGEKKIESRWYKSKRAPWNRIQAGEIVYFKDAGKAVTAKAEVEKILQFEQYTLEQLEDIIKKYGGKGGICFSGSYEPTLSWTRDKKYCILVFLKNAQNVEPFKIDKTGFGNACAWICVDKIERIKQK